MQRDDATQVARAKNVPNPDFISHALRMGNWHPERNYMIVEGVIFHNLALEKPNSGYVLD
jgi:hypothetical protein